MRTTSMLAGAACVVAAMTLNVQAANAAGQVEQGPQNAKSICSYSGLNDEPDAEYPEGGRTQSYGQLVRQGAIAPSEVKGGEPSPGTLCNPNNLPLK